MTAQSTTQFRSPTLGTNPSTTFVLADITGPALKRAREYSRATTTGQDHMCTAVSVDGPRMTMLDVIDLCSDSAIRRQQMLISMQEIVTSIALSTVVLQATLQELFASKTRPCLGGTNI